PRQLFPGGRDLLHTLVHCQSSDESDRYRSSRGNQTATLGSAILRGIEALDVDPVRHSVPNYAALGWTQNPLGACEFEQGWRDTDVCSTESRRKGFQPAVQATLPSRFRFQCQTPNQEE